MRSLHWKNYEITMRKLKALLCNKAEMLNINMPVEKEQ